MSIAMMNRVGQLERQVAELLAWKKAQESNQAAARAVVADLPKEKGLNKVPRQMCPHCGVKPNYFLHTRSCRGPWQGK